jgi:hypothetical protein
MFVNSFRKKCKAYARKRYERKLVREMVKVAKAILSEKKLSERKAHSILQSVRNVDGR